MSSYPLCTGRKEGFQLNISVDLYPQNKLIFLEITIQETLTKMHIGNKKKKITSSSCILLHYIEVVVEKNQNCFKAKQFENID